MEELSLKKIFACGTIRPSRNDFPALQEGSSITDLPYINGITVYK